MSQKTPSPAKLKQGLESLSDDALEESVETAEGVNGSTIEPVYSKRKMKAYTVTESELKQIGLANIGITGTASIGSAFFVFGLDILKDTVLATEVPKEAAAIVSYVQPISFFIGVAFWLFSAVLMYWRRDMINTIKKESTDH